MSSNFFLSIELILHLTFTLNERKRERTVAEWYAEWRRRGGVPAWGEMQQGRAPGVAREGAKKKEREHCAFVTILAELTIRTNSLLGRAVSKDADSLWADLDALMALFRASRTDSHLLGRHQVRCSLGPGGEPPLPSLSDDEAARVAEDRHWFNIVYSFLPPPWQHADATSAASPLANLRVHMSYLSVLTETLVLAGNEDLLPTVTTCTPAYVSAYEVESVEIVIAVADLIEAWVRIWNLLPFEAQVRRVDEARGRAEEFAQRYSVGQEGGERERERERGRKRVVGRVTPSTIDGLYAQADSELGKVAEYIDTTTRATAHWPPLHALSRYAAATALVGELAVDAARVALDTSARLGLAQETGTERERERERGRGGGGGGGGTGGGRPTPVELPSAALAVAVARSAHGPLRRTARPSSLVSRGLDEALRLAQEQGAVSASVVVEGVRALLELGAVVEGGGGERERERERVGGGGGVGWYRGEWERVGERERW
jgi:hypothetical protein